MSWTRFIIENGALGVLGYGFLGSIVVISTKNHQPEPPRPRRWRGREEADEENFVNHHAFGQF